MGALNEDQQKIYDAQQKAIAECNSYFFGGETGQISGFDSIAIQPSQRPAVLQACFDSIGEEYGGKIDLAVKTGVEIYASRNGGDMPHASVVAAALCSASQAQLGDFKGFDSIQGYDQSAIVPAMTVATIISVIANALPIVAMLPNPTKSVRVPIVSIRYATDSSFGAMRQGEYIDGKNAAAPYAEGRFRFALSNTNGAVYAVAAHTLYANYATKTPDTTAPKLPFLGGNVSIRVNGKEVAHTRDEHQNSVTSGVLVAKSKPNGVTLAGAKYVVTASAINLTDKTISVTFDKALPVGAKVEVFLVADFNAKENRNFILTPVGLAIDPEFDSIQSVPIVGRITLPHTLQNQLANELGLGFVGSALAHMQGKVFLEQNVRLLGEAKERAKLSGHTSVFDASRGVAGNVASIANNTGDLFGEIMPRIHKAKSQIIQSSGGATVKFSIYVGDLGATYMKTLSADKFKPTGVIASYGEIVRIGTLTDGTDVYHTPTTQGVIAEAVSSAEFLLVGSGSEPVRNPFVGTITEAPTFREATADTREANFGMHAQMAAEQNPLDRYAEQVWVIDAINLPPL